MEEATEHAKPKPITDRESKEMKTSEEQRGTVANLLRAGLTSPSGDVQLRTAMALAICERIQGLEEAIDRLTAANREGMEMVMQGGEAQRETLQTGIGQNQEMLEEMKAVRRSLGASEQ